ncbi:MAG: MBL fold metallo-hydrolase [Sedimentisphaerales bacterium]|nr:MBL fold metallo-hydrolase [Sedimentisphaerales bacterium]
MGLYFKSLCSSSSGNSIVLWSDKTRIMIDCGFGSMKRCRTAFREHMNNPVDHQAVLLSHVHSDHISYYPLRVLEEMRIPVYVHNGSVALLRDKHFNGNNFTGLNLQTFDKDAFSVGQFIVEPIEVVHHPWYPTFGFVIHYQTAHRQYKVVTITDFCQWQDVVRQLADADFVFIESNHDLELLEIYYNPNSRFHMPNPETARLLCEARRQSIRPFETVMLGHISSQRNRASIALEETRRAFAEMELDLDFPLLAAPLREPSETVIIAE